MNARFSSEDASEIAGRLLVEQAELVHERTDRLFVYVMLTQWLSGIAVSLIVSPRAWAGAESTGHAHVWAALLWGGAISLGPVAMAWRYPGQVLTRHVVAVAQMLWSALLIHLSGGRIETHFHVFGSLALLSFYRSWPVLTSAALTIVLDHVARTYWWPQSVFGSPLVDSFRWLEHAFWVACEYAILATAVSRGLRDLRESCTQQAELQLVNHNFEEQVRLRTEELESVNRNLLFEIQERRQAESESNHLNEQLLKSTRQAGMAEVATGVLHNVGNVLNSVNVSLTTVLERLRATRLPGLARSLELIEQHRGRLAWFLVEDLRGQKLPDYLRQLSAMLEEEQAGMREELYSLRKNVDHITEIVSMQQTYARTAGATEQFNVQELIEDALRINDAGLLRHGVDLHCEFAELPAVIADKHKLLQILVNLISNAKHAVSQNLIGEPTRLREIHVSTAQPTPQTVVVEVRDTGVGIEPENLTRIFNHGFTTKKEGHGFGLHCSAMAAGELGGCLSVHSDGPGRGATFRVVFPLSKWPADPSTLAECTGTEILPSSYDD